MSDDLLLKTKPANNLGLIILDNLPHLLDEKQMMIELNGIANAVARQARDFKSSAKIREIIENPDKMEEKFNCLKRALRFKAMARAFMVLYEQTEMTATGLFNEAIEGFKYNPQFALPDNEFGRYLIKQLTELFTELEVVKPGAFEAKKIDINPAKKIIEG